MTSKTLQQMLVPAIVVAVLVVDQLIKIWVKTHMYLHEHIHITDWFYIFFTENNGMAFGMEIIGKLFLTLFRLVAVTAISWFVYKVIAKGAKTGFILCLALVIAGAAGNIIDCVFYGQVFSESTHTELAHWVSFGEGYESLLHGRVVDMFYFPLVEFDWPQWVPFLAGRHFIFFSPIFNFADAAISCGVIAMLIWYRKSLSEHFNEV